jgi:hypothetical protein
LRRLQGGITVGFTDIFKDVYAIAKRINDAELLRGMAVLKLEYVRLAEDNVQLREKLLALTEELKIKDEMVHHDNLYWRIPGGGAEEEGPFCVPCFSTRKHVVPMKEEPWSYKCPACGDSVEKPGAPPPDQPMNPDPTY